MAYNLDGYVTVAERLTLAGEQIQTVISEPAVMLTDAMGYIRATVALKDGRSATATASFKLDLQGRSAQATNPIEDCETSAIGRALGFLGYGSSKSVASREEVQEAHRRADAPTRGATFTPPQQRQQPPQREYVPAPAADAPPLCPVHNKPMRPGSKGGYFCATKLDDGSWCKARPEKPQPQPQPRTIPDDWDAEYDAVEASEAQR